MNKLLLSFFLLPLLASAQTTRVDTVKVSPRKATFPKYKTHILYSYSAGLKVFGLEELPQILNQVDENKLRKQYADGFIFRFNDNQISYRLTGSFYSDQISFDNECVDCERAKGKVTDNALRVGFEKNLVYADIQPYFGLDLGYRRNSFKGDVTNIDTARYKSPYQAYTLKNGMSISPLLGIKFNVWDHFTIAAESSLDFVYSYEKQEKSYKTSASPRTVADYSKWEFLLRPIAMISLQYNFSEKY